MMQGNERPTFECPRCAGRGWILLDVNATAETWPLACGACHGAGNIPRVRLLEVLDVGGSALDRVRKMIAGTRASMSVLAAIEREFPEILNTPRMRQTTIEERPTVYRPQWEQLEHLVEAARTRGWSSEQIEYLASCVGIAWAKGAEDARLKTEERRRPEAQQGGARQDTTV